MAHYFLKPRHLLAITSICLLALSVAACSDSPNLEDGLSRDEIFDQIDQDNDGVALRSDYLMTVTLMDPTKVVASHPQGDLTVEAVLDSLEASPPSGLTDPANPSTRLFAARLTSMLRLRLAAAAIEGAGFAIEFEVDDEQLNSQVQAHLTGGFEDWARERAFQADPRLEKFSTPHCVTLIAVASERARNHDSGEWRCWMRRFTYMGQHIRRKRSASRRDVCRRSVGSGFDVFGIQPNRSPVDGLLPARITRRSERSHTARPIRPTSARGPGHRVPSHCRSERRNLGFDGVVSSARSIV